MMIKVFPITFLNYSINFFSLTTVGSTYALSANGNDWLVPAIWKSPSILNTIQSGVNLNDPENKYFKYFAC